MGEQSFETMPRLTLQERERALGLLEAGTSQTAVARRLHVNQSTISHLVSRHQQTGSVADRPRPGQLPVTTARQDRQIRLAHLRDRFRTAATTAANTIGRHGRRIHPITVRRRLRQAGLRPRRPYRGPILQPRHRQARRQFAHRYGRQPRLFFRRIVFSDESRYCVSFVDGRERVYRRHGERYANACVRQRDRFGGGSVMVWGAINAGFRSDLHVIQGNLTAQRYVDEILRAEVVPLLRRHQRRRRQLIFQHDNARPHAARVTQAFIQEARINVMDWPAYSPDLNPIEHLWDELGRQVYRRPIPPATVADLTLALHQEWRNIPMAFITRLCDSMPQRIHACARADGGHTRY